MKKAKVRVWCGCGWEEWIDFDPDITNEEITKLIKPVLDKHTKKEHGYIIQ